ncbi:MAG TPA: bifunctional riboflavin kinase/FAD synthetase [Lacisediminihabitans sp.]|uniref:bifunctional riboflavin kinase/FAD synthetase n=1 Tax=Lacisediminihabitans sp. TaxID=2787631 RepID=UPI002ED8CD13
MLFFGSLDDVPADFGPSAVTIGKFDGLHVGHRRVIDQLRAAADAEGLVSTVVTFDRNPLAVLHPEICPVSLSSNEQKRARLESTGIDATVMIEFTPEFSRLSPEDFVHRVLVDGLHARLVYVGSDFRFGHGGAGTVDLLVELGAESGYEVRIIEPVRPDGKRPISSTWIRSLLADGLVGEAAELLGRLPSVRGEVVRGEQRGRELGYPTANLSPSLEGFVPADGVYAGYLTLDGQMKPAAISIGNNPTFEGVADKQVEAHVLDETIDLYGRTVEVSFVEFIRGMRKFPDVRELVAQMKRDETQIREILRLPLRPPTTGQPA